MGSGKSYSDLFDLALEWMEERTNDCIVKTPLISGLENAGIPRTVRGKRIEGMCKSDKESRPVIFVLIQDQLEFSAPIDTPTALVDPSIDAFHEFIHANDPFLVVGEREIKGLGEPPAEVSFEAGEILDLINDEYHSYGRSLHGSSHATKIVKGYIKELKQLPLVQAPAEDQIIFWMLRNDWEGTGIRNFLKYWGKTKP